MSELAIIVNRLRVMRAVLVMFECVGDLAEAALTRARIDELLDAYNEARASH